MTMNFAEGCISVFIWRQIASGLLTLSFRDDLSSQSEQNTGKRRYSCALENRIDQLQ